MPTVSTVTSKGQVTLPKQIRDRLGIQRGDRIEFVDEGGDLRIRKVLRENPFSRYRGYLKDLAGADVDSLLDEIRGE